MYNTVTQEQQIINWFQNIWDSHKYDRDSKQEITDRIQDDINANHFREEDLAEIAQAGSQLWVDPKNKMSNRTKYIFPWKTRGSATNNR